MRIVAAIVGLFVLGVILWDTFETIVMPRTVINRVRFTNLFYHVSWRAWYRLSLWRGDGRDRFLSAFGPLSLLMLLATWAAGIIFGFALLHFAAGSRIAVPYGGSGFLADLYFSGTTVFTLGLGDVWPRAPMDRFLTVAEAGMGLGFLAIVIGYFPVLYQAFSRREVLISFLDARAGSPPTAGELLRRHGEAGVAADLPALLYQFESWAAEVLESHLSFPVLAFYRSQHDRESWLSTLVTILDTCTLVAAGTGEVPAWQAQLTFAMARHAVVDLALVFNTPPRAMEADRLPPEEEARLAAALEGAGLPMRQDATGDRIRREMRGLYEPYVSALAAYLHLELPPFLPERREADNWQTTAWDGRPHF